jgi:glycosyltransferase involved in cell wall biosynthesis
MKHFSLCIISHNAYGAISGGKSGFIGGIEWQTSFLARRFANQISSVTMLTWDEGNKDEESFDGVRVVKICKSTAGLPGIRFFHPKWTGLLRALGNADADIYYQNGSECVTGQVALWCKRNKRPFVFCAASNADCDTNLPELKSWQERLLFRYGVRNANLRIVQTLTQQKMFKDNFGLNSKVIPMPCPAPDILHAPQFFAKPNRILWIGRVCQVKRPDRLLELAKLNPTLEFDIVGPWSVDNHIQTIKQAAQQISNLKIHGAVSRNLVSNFYKSASLLCCTSDYEGFPNTFLEAWSYGLPIVSTFDPDSLINNRQLGIAAANVMELSNGIQKLLTNTDLYSKTSQNAQNYFTTTHTADAVFPRFEQAFQSLLQHR